MQGYKSPIDFNWTDVSKCLAPPLKLTGPKSAYVSWIISTAI